MEPNFADVKIVGLEEELTVESPENPELRYVYFRLSQTPLPIWQSHFKESRKISRHPHWRHAWIDRKYIVVECLPEEIEKYHLQDLKQDVSKANQGCQNYLRTHSRADHDKESAHQHAVDRLREIKGRLNFD
jgi:hypothetical protein